MEVRAAFWKNGSLDAEFNEKTEAATSSYSAAVDFLQHLFDACG